MKAIYVFLILIIAFVFTNSQMPINAQEPITTPIQWTGLDTLSKYAHREPLPLTQSDKSKIFDNKHDKTLGTIITDPRVTFSTYFGGNGYDCSFGLAVDSKDFIYICGYTGSTDLPTTENALQKTKSGGHDAFIAKFTQSGQPVWITYYGGSGTDVAMDMLCDKQDNLLICGKTNSNNLSQASSTYSGDADCFILKLNENGELIFSKYFGGNRYESAEGIALFTDGGFVITGYTNSKNFPVTEDAFQKEIKLAWDTKYDVSKDPDAFISRFDSEGNMTYCTYFGANYDVLAYAIAVDQDDNYAFCGYVKGCSDFPVTENAFQKDTTGVEDCFIAKFNYTNQLEWATLYGGSSKDVLKAINSDAKGNFYVGGYTESNDFHISDNAYQKAMNWLTDAVLVSFDKDGEMLWSTYWGGNSGEEIIKIKCINKTLWIIGYTSSTDLDTSKTALPNFYPDDEQPNIYLLQMDLSGYPIWVSYYSGGQNDFGYNVIYNNNKLFFTGETRSIRFPVTDGAFQEICGDAEYDGFLVNVNMEGTPVYEISESEDFYLYPNPSNDFIIVTNKNIQDNQLSQKHFEIYNPLGQILGIYYTNFCDITNLPKGYYFLKIHYNNKFQIISFVKN